MKFGYDVGMYRMGRGNLLYEIFIKKRAIVGTYISVDGLLLRNFGNFILCHFEEYTIQMTSVTVDTLTEAISEVLVNFLQHVY